MSENKLPIKRVAKGVAGIGLGFLATQIPLDPIEYAGYAMELAGTGYVGWHVRRYIRNYSSTLAVLDRARAEAMKHNGTGTKAQRRKSASPRAMRRQARSVLPESTKGLSWIDLHRVDKRAYSVFQGTEAKLGKIYSSVEDVTVIMGGPRKGKSAMMACYVVDAPGACIVTSTRADLARTTIPVREKVGPIHIFDPASTSGLGNTIKWPVLTGCRNPRTAMRRAQDMVPHRVDESGGNWSDLARQALAVLIYAAALKGESMFRVLAWASRPKYPEFRKEVEEAIQELAPPETAVAWSEMASAFFGNNDRTLTSITTTLLKSLDWLKDPKAAAMGMATDSFEGELFDVKDLIDTSGTVYMIGDQSDGVAPVVAAFTGEIAYQSRVLALARGGRLEPPLTLVLDEAANICPVPLDRWTSFMGGHNITIHMSVQDPSQLAMIWGLGAQSIQDHAATLVIFGGIQDARFLKECVDKTDIIIETESGSRQRIPTITPAEIMSLPKHRALVFRSGMSYVIVSTPNVYKRKDVKRAAEQSPVKTVLDTDYAEAEFTKTATKKEGAR